MPAPERDSCIARSVVQTSGPPGVPGRRSRGRGRVGRREGATTGGAAAGGSTTAAAATTAAGAGLHGRGGAGPPRHRGDRRAGPAHPGPPRRGSGDRRGGRAAPGRPPAARAGAARFLRGSGAPHHRRRGLDEPGRPARPPLRLRVRPVAHLPAERAGRPARGGTLPPHPGPPGRPRGSLRPSGSRRPGGLHGRRGQGDRRPAEPVRISRAGPLHRHRRDPGVRGVRDRPRQPAGPAAGPAAPQRGGRLRRQRDGRAGCEPLGREPGGLPGPPVS